MDANYYNLILRCGVTYLAAGFGKTIMIYYTSNGVNFCNVTLNSTLYDVRISNTSLYVTTHTTFYQFNISTCTLFDSSYTGAPFRINIIQKSVLNSI